MKVKQITGPFTKGQTITISPERGDDLFVHVGVQVPERWPIKDWGRESEYSPVFAIRGVTETFAVLEHKFAINEPGVLEFDGLAEEELELTALIDLPPETIIDVVYRTWEDE